MKGYGLPRHHDIHDAVEFAPKSSDRNIPGKGGDIRSDKKSSSSKRNLRRLYKRRARRINKKECEIIE